MADDQKFISVPEQFEKSKNLLLWMSVLCIFASLAIVEDGALSTPVGVKIPQILLVLCAAVGVLYCYRQFTYKLGLYKRYNNSISVMTGKTIQIVYEELINECENLKNNIVNSHAYTQPLSENMLEHATGVMDNSMMAPDNIHALYSLGQIVGQYQIDGDRDNGVALSEAVKNAKDEIIRIYDLQLSTAIPNYLRNTLSPIDDYFSSSESLLKCLVAQTEELVSKLEILTNFLIGTPKAINLTSSSLTKRRLKFWQSLACRPLCGSSPKANSVDPYSLAYLLGQHAAQLIESRALPRGRRRNPGH